MGEIPNLVNKLTAAYVNPTAANNSIDTGDSTQYSEDSGEVNPILGNQHKCESGMSEKIIEIAETE